MLSAPSAPDGNFLPPASFPSRLQIETLIRVPAPDLILYATSVRRLLRQIFASHLSYSLHRSKEN
jgi:hypothetical protein